MISSTITTALASLEAQVTAATPLIDTPHANIVAIQLNAANLVIAIQAALVADTSLDTWTAKIDALSIIRGVLGQLSEAQDQSNLSLMRGVTGRASANLDQFT